MTALQRIREEQEKLAADPGPGTLDDSGWREIQRRWLKLQREVLAISRGELCEEHAFVDCQICKILPGWIPRDDHPYGRGLMDAPSLNPPSLPEQMKDASRDPLPLSDRDPGDENDFKRGTP